MKTILSTNNPFRNTIRLEHAFVWEFLNQQENKFEKILDYGSYNGNLLKELANSNLLKNGVGVDLNKHIHRQDVILSELNRILRPGGLLIVSVPGKHFFSFLDFGNWKFLFPRIHKLYILLRFGKSFYNERYVDCKNGLFGDIEVEKKWHEHFELNRLSELLANFGFITKESDGFGFFFRLIHNIHYLSPFFKKHLYNLMKKDMIKYNEAEIFVAAEKLKE